MRKLRTGMAVLAMSMALSAITGGGYVFAENVSGQEQVRQTNIYAAMGVCVAENGCSIYEEPGLNSKKTGNLSSGDMIRILGKTTDENGSFWYKVRFYDDYNGKQAELREFADIDYLTGYVPAGALINGEDALAKIIEYGYLYAYADGDAPIYLAADAENPVDRMYLRDVLKVSGKIGSRLELVMYDGGKGYVETGDVFLFTDQDASIAEARRQEVYAAELEATLQAAQQAMQSAPEPAPAQVVDPRQQITNVILATSQQYLGRPYVLGGNSLTEGIDCSGFIQQIYAGAGVSLPRYSAEQYNATARVGAENLLPGDLVFYHGYYDGVPTPGVGHVAIYLGNGTIIHARNKDRGICLDPVDTLPVVGYGRAY